jgi:hypothetical protein
MKICVRPKARQPWRASYTTPLLCREVLRENRVNQSGSVALSMEAMPRAARVAIY